jgi:hypothetical protein
MGGWGKKYNMGLKVPMHCPFVLSVSEKHLTGIIEI